ncbi:response regulator [Magnetococcales bacterium HHB-1]
MIEDLELRELFKAESEEHLEKLDAGLLHLENQPADQSTLKEMFREAHSLKGAARMLGVGDVETLAHKFEDMLGAASKGQMTFTPEVIDRLILGLDHIRQLVAEAVDGSKPQITLSSALAILKGEQQAETRPEKTPSKPPSPEEALILQETDVIDHVAQEPSPSTDSIIPEERPPSHTESPLEPPFSSPQEKITPPTSTPVARIIEEIPEATTPPPSSVDLIKSPPSTEPAPPALTPEKAIDLHPETTAAQPDQGEPYAEVVSQPQEQSPTSQTKHQINTIRVKPKKLDKLLRQAGELTVVKTRIKRRLTELEDILGSWEKCQKSISQLSQFAQQKNAPFTEELFTPFEQINNQLNHFRRALFDDETSMDILSQDLEDDIRNLRLLPLSTLFNLFPRMVRDLSRQLDKQVQLELVGSETTADKRIIEELKDPLMHMIRNAIDHALESPEQRIAQKKPEKGTIRLKGSQTTTHVLIELSDDGRGLNFKGIRQQALKQNLRTEKELDALSQSQLANLIFQSGFSTRSMITDLSGRGVGLDAVRASVERLKGTVHVESAPGQGCKFTLKLPITLATTPVFIVSCAKQKFAIPLDYVHSTKRIDPKDIFPIEGQATFKLNQEPISIAYLADLLQIPHKKSEKCNQQSSPCIILSANEEKVGILVDELLDELEVVMKPHSAILQRVRNISGATILGTGEVCMAINPVDLIRTLQSQTNIMLDNNQSTPTLDHEGEEQEQSALILLAEDSITTRTQEKRILENAGYNVITAVDGLDAFTKLGKHPFDAVISDVEMPNMTGLELCEKIRQNNTYQDLPIILVTSLSSEDDLRRGMEAGANAYISKTSFEQKGLIDALRRLV